MATQKKQSEEKNRNPKLIIDLTKKEIEDNTWMIRPCKIYKDEWAECGTIGGRLHQRYVYGKTLDCTKWWSDYEFCQKYENTKDLKYAEPIIIQELERRQVRLEGARGNIVWEYREAPPPKWYAPVPEHLKSASTHAFEDIENNSNPTATVKSKISQQCTIL